MPVIKGKLELSRMTSWVDSQKAEYFQLRLYDDTSGSQLFEINIAYNELGRLLGSSDPVKLPASVMNTERIGKKRVERKVDLPMDPGWSFADADLKPWFEKNVTPLLVDGWQSYSVDQRAYISADWSKRLVTITLFRWEEPKPPPEPPFPKPAPLVMS